ncbi:hypothetical protein ACSDQ9_00495 [Aestuariimicrobium soli]|uniref:hypothetical protein n=1 Tax=Aestuariimicrobium soli TaxID=2035834 RepID=UPI003EBACA58
MTAVATSQLNPQLNPFAVPTKPRTRARRDRVVSGPRPVGPALRPQRRTVIAPAIQGANVRACSDVAGDVAGGAVAPLSTAGALRLTDRGLAVVLGGFACLALLTLAVLVDVFLSFSNAPLA